mmetsp:Transcript_2176/g.3298  ORF Transcript_2176/g.3298 Transcript_2176/m.3298 type:complete len:134 (+) Transcript_2176:22-423(+)
MDGQLSSSRQYGSGGGDGGYNSNRRGRGRGGHRNNHRGRGRGGYNRDRDDRRHQPYRRGGGRHGDGGRRQPGNRFDNSSSTTSVDPQSAMLKQLTTMVAKMGDLISSAETAASLGLDSSENENNNMRGVVHAI